MAHVYTPGLRVATKIIIRKRRILPIPGEVLVKGGDQVAASTVVARTLLPGRVHAVNVVNLLGITPEEIRSYILKKEGDPVREGEAIVENKPLIKWFKTQVKAPVKGTVESISEVTGQVLLREPPHPLELQAYIDGEVVEVIPNEGAVVEATCSFVQGIFGIGGETTGVLQMAVESPEEALTPDRIHEEHRGAILVGGSFVGRDGLKRAKEVGVKALVVGGMNDLDLRGLLGYDLGVAITGTEQVGFTLILTEGFGRIPMAKRTFDLLASMAGRKASASGATQIRAGVIRPEVIIPLDWEWRGGGAGELGRGEFTLAPLHLRSSAQLEEGGLKVGDTIRIIREPYFGLMAKVKALPTELQLISTESKVRVLVAELPDGTTLTIPRANVEQIEE